MYSKQHDNGFYAYMHYWRVFFFQAEDGIRDLTVTGVQTCALPIWYHSSVAELRDRLQAALGDAYRVERELGGGGMSRVFAARDVELGRIVVVKVLPPEMAAGVNAERFRREIQLAASLQHPHIVPLLHAGHADDLVYS